MIVVVSFCKVGEFYDIPLNWGREMQPQKVKFSQVLTRPFKLGL